MQIGIGRFSSYIVDVDALMAEIQREQTERYARTARRPCSLRLHPHDGAAVEMALAAGRLGTAGALPELYGVLTIFGMPVIRTGQQPLGAFTITQCQMSLYTPGRCNCPSD